MRKRLTYSNVMSTIAVFGVLAGGTALAAGEITSRDIADRTIKARDLKNGAVKRGKLGTGAVGGLKLRNVTTRFNSTALPDNGTLQSAHAECAPGERLIGGGANFDPAAGSDTPLIASRPSVDVGGAPSNGGTFNVWRATAINVAGGTGATSIKAWALCIG